MIESIRELLSDAGYEDSVMIDGMDDAIVGVSTDGNIVYDYTLMLAILMRDDDMSDMDSREFIDYNIVRATPYYDPAPIIINRLEDI